MNYYHIRFVLKDGATEYHHLDMTDLDSLIADYIIPFQSNDRFRVDDSFICGNEVRTVLVTKTIVDSSALADYLFNKSQMTWSNDRAVFSTKKRLLF